MEVVEFKQLKKYDNSERLVILEKDNNDKSESQLLWDTVATAGKIAMVVALIIGGCIYLGEDKRPPMEKATAERDKNCNVAKKTENLKSISIYCK
jgi:hypothetical protein